MTYALSDEINVIDSDDLEVHWQPVRSAILATAGLLVWDTVQTLMRNREQ